MDHPAPAHNDPLAASHQPYPFYQHTGDDDHQSYAMGYPPQMTPYGQMTNMPPRSLSQQDMAHFQQLSGMPPMMNAHQMPAYPHPGGMYPGQAPQHVPGDFPLVGSPPASPYDPLSPPVSGSEASGGEGLYHSRASSGAASPASSSRRNSLIRGAHRYNPTPSPSASEGRRSRGRSISDDEEGMGMPAENIASSRKEATRKQRIEAEQRRRDELRDGYSKLKDVLPVSNSKSSKVSLLDRATKHIVDLEKRNEELEQRLAALDDEVRRLRVLNEKIFAAGGIPPGTTMDTPPASGADMHTPLMAHATVMDMRDPRPLTPPGSLKASKVLPGGEEMHHSLTSVAGQVAPKSDSSGSDDDF